MHELIHPQAAPGDLERMQSTSETQISAIRKLSIIIPAYNEAATISTILDKVSGTQLDFGIEKEIIVINDCSTDDTDRTIKDYILHNPQAGIAYFSHSSNQGKGGAIHTGIQKATGDYLIIQDADLEYDPSDYNAMLLPIIKANADVVYGSRFLGGSAHRILFFWHTIGNRFLTFLSNMCTNLNLTDMETGYKMFRTSIIQQMPLQEKRFGFEPEVTARISRFRGIRIYEVGISYYGRTFQEGKKIGWKDGVRALYCIIKYKLVKHGHATNVIEQRPGTVRQVAKQSVTTAQAVDI
jgi:glycosyltransferase involved in cell wall biosynthesis